MCSDPTKSFEPHGNSAETKKFVYDVGVVGSDRQNSLGQFHSFPANFYCRFLSFSTKTVLHFKQHCPPVFRQNFSSVQPFLLPIKPYMS
jgi:hypothetical protein